MSKVTIEIDDSQVVHELDRLIRGMSLADTLELEGSVMEIVAEVAAIVHIETGSLKSTVRPADGGFDDTGVTWKGGVVVGGAAPGSINDPAYYGVYELARGGDHFFLEPAYTDLPVVVREAIVSFMVGSLEAESSAAKGEGASFAKAEAHKLSGRTMSEEELRKRAKTVSKVAKKRSKSSSDFYLG